MKPSKELLEMSQASADGDLDAVRALLKAHPELERMRPYHGGSTWLHSAAQSGNIALAEFWLRRGWDVNTNDPGCGPNDGLYTPLHFAKGVAMTRYLLSQGANANAFSREFGTALHNAVAWTTDPSQKGHRREGGADMEQIRTLLDAGADPSLMNGQDKGYTPLGWEIYLGKKSAAQFLREAGAPETGQRPFGDPPRVDTLDLR